MGNKNPTTPKDALNRYELIAWDGDAFNRHELRRYQDRYEMLHLRPQIGGGWFIKNSIVVALI